MCCSESHHNAPQVSNVLVNQSWGDDGWCTCPGQRGGGCCGNATADDGLCDRCRTHCKAGQPVTAAAEPEPAAAS